ncbi:MAG: hypothetical protein ACK4IX_17075, partial [Candidatus Sericytochromatia bacterium]
MMWNIEDKISSELKLIKFIEENHNVETDLSKEALERCKKIGIYPIDYILSKNIISEDEIVNILSEKFHYPKSDTIKASKDKEINNIIKPEFASYHTLLILNSDSSNLTISIFNP